MKHYVLIVSREITHVKITHVKIAHVKIAYAKITYVKIVYAKTARRMIGCTARYDTLLCAGAVDWPQRIVSRETFEKTDYIVLY